MGPLSHIFKRTYFIQMNAFTRLLFFQRLSTANPHPRSELEYRSPFELLTAVMLSAQATDVGVNKATRRLFAVASTPNDILALGQEKLESYLSSLNFYKTKTRHLLATCQILIESNHGEVPQSRAALEALPGVGRKTANVLLNILFGEETIAVDTHIFRLANRTGLAPGKNVDLVEKKLLKLTPPQFRKEAHHWLVLHGRYTCKARQPLCQNCILNDLCDFKQKRTPP